MDKHVATCSRFKFSEVLPGKTKENIDLRLTQKLENILVFIFSNIDLGTLVYAKLAVLTLEVVK